MRMMPSLFKWRYEAGLFILALIARISLWPWFRTLGLSGDEKYYWSQVAFQVAHGQVLTVYHQLRPPLWGYFLALPALFSQDPFIGRLLAVLLGALTVVFVYWTASVVFNHRTGVVTGIIFALYPEHVYFSHYLWAETLTGLLLAISVWLYWTATNKASRDGRLLLSFLFCGLALLAKEFAIVVFVGMIAAFPVLFRRGRLLAGCCACFILPAMIYCLASWANTGHPVILSKTPVANLQQTLGNKFNSRVQYSDTVSFLRGFFNKSPSQHGLHFKKIMCNLWSQNSFPIHRLVGTNADGVRDAGKYSMPRRREQAVLIGVAHVLVVIAALAGLIAMDDKRFRLFVILALTLLTIPTTFALMVSRFRLPFLFLVILCAGYAIANPGAIRSRMTSWQTRVTFAISLLIFGAIVYFAWPVFGKWG